MKKSTKLLSLLLCMTMLVMTGSTVFATENHDKSPISKDESVYVMLNPDGTVKEQIVSDWLHSDKGFDNVRDKSSLTNIENLKSDAAPQLNGDTITWNAEETDIYYQGNIDKTPPVEVSIRYQLDGRDISAEDLLGQSGRVSITFTLRNNEKRTAVISGKERTVYTPFAAALVCNMQSPVFQNVSAQKGSVQTDSQNQMAVFLAFPGVKESFAGVLDEELGDLKNELSDTFTIEADAADFSMPEIFLAVATNLAGLKETSVTPEFDDLFDGMDKLNAATGKLLSGTDELLKSAGTFDEKMGQFKDSYNQFDTGVLSAYNGAKQLKEGADELKSASSTLKSKVTDELIPAIKAAAPLQQDLQKQMASLEKQLSNLKLPDMDEMGAKLAAAINTVCDKSSDVTLQIATGKTFDDLSPQQQAMLKGAKDQIKKTAGQEISAMMASLDLSALDSLKATLLDIKETAGKLMGGMQTLTDALYSPSDDVKNPKTLANAIIALSVGADKLQSGAGDLTDGLSALSASSKTVKDAIGQFKDGTSALKNGTKTLDDGMRQFSEEGIKPLTDNKDALLQAQTAVDIMEQMKTQGESYTNYTGITNDMEGTVKFVMKVQPVEKAETTQQTNESGDSQEEQPNFWQRLWNLFTGLFH